MNRLPTLEQRIAAALTSTDITSTDLAALIEAVEVAAQVADENATKVREQALDPAVAVDTTKVATARPSGASASSRSRRPPRLRQPRSATGRLIASAGDRADNSLG